MSTAKVQILKFMFSTCSLESRLKGESEKNRLNSRQLFCNAISVTQEFKYLDRWFLLVAPDSHSKTESEQNTGFHWK